jgi:hypothetical protein
MTEFLNNMPPCPFLWLMLLAVPAFLISFLILCITDFVRRRVEKNDRA